MANSRPTVVIGFLGLNLDATGSRRWDRWRPSVDLCRQEDLIVDRFELIATRASAKLAESVRTDIAAVSPETEVRLHFVEFEDAWDFGEVFEKTDAFVRSLELEPEREDYLVHITTGTHVVQICLFLLVETRRIPARLLQTSPPRRAGAERGTVQVIDLDLSKYDRLAQRFRREQEERLSSLKGGIATRNAEFNRLIERIERVAVASRAPLLLLGPTGAGKSQLARRIFELKRSGARLEGPFVEVNCAVLRGEGAMSTLFGHKRGAFTGAVSDRQGLLRTANGGLLFLDEVGELGLDEQAMLLRALEERRFLPVGSDREVESDFQLIAGTNRDLRIAVAQGRFREDLLARIDLWSFSLPGLSERPEDIEPNLEWELERFEERHGFRVSFNREARERFLGFATSREALWKGNFRDFGAALVRMATLAPAGRIDVATVEEELERLRRAWAAPALATPKVLERHLAPEAIAQLDRFDRVQLEDVLAVCERSRSLSDAGRTLFACSRALKATSNDADRLRKYLARFGLDWKRVHASGGEESS
jgi:transcriptional regulatory protein RtcR